MSDARPRLTRNADRVLEARYLRRDEAGEVVETPRDLLRRVARGVAEAELRLHGPDEAERWERTFLECLLDLELLPNSPTLMNAGTALGQLAACFVLPVPDSIDGIFRSLRDMALIQKSGGGTGFAFSRLRPRGARIASTGGTSSGPVSFMQVFECATGQIAQAARREHGDPAGGPSRHRGVHRREAPRGRVPELQPFGRRDGRVPGGRVERSPVRPPRPA